MACQRCPDRHLNIRCVSGGGGLTCLVWARGGGDPIEGPPVPISPTPCPWRTSTPPRPTGRTGSSSSWGTTSCTSRTPPARTPLQILGRGPLPSRRSDPQPPLPFPTSQHLNIVEPFFRVVSIVFHLRPDDLSYWLCLDTVVFHPKDPEPRSTGAPGADFRQLAHHDWRTGTPSRRSPLCSSGSES